MSSSLAGRAIPLATDRLVLEPLRPGHAVEMTGVLADPRLYAFIGGEPPTTDDLRRRYAFQAIGRSPDGAEAWLNWIVRRRVEGDAIGFVQATVRDGTADVAWLIGVHVHPEHRASEAVARKLGLSPTDELEDGERIWRAEAVAAAPA